MSQLEFASSLVFILPCCVVGLLWAIWNFSTVYKIKLSVEKQELKGLADHEAGIDKNKLMLEIGEKIQTGADEFL